jgi:hypothetical protein
MSSRGFEQMLDEMLARLAAEGVTITREQLRVKVAATFRDRPAVLDGEGCIVDFVTGGEPEHWPPLAN